MWNPDEIPLPRFLPRTTSLLLLLRNRSRKAVHILAEEWRPLPGALLDSLSAELEPGSSVCFSVQVGCQLLLTLDDEETEKHFLRQPHGGLPSWSPGGRLVSAPPRELGPPPLPPWSLLADIVPTSMVTAPAPDVLAGIPATVSEAVEKLGDRLPSARTFVNAWRKLAPDIPEEGACTIIAVITNDDDYSFMLESHVIIGTALFFEAGVSQSGSETLLDGGTFRYSVHASLLEAALIPKNRSQPVIHLYGDAREVPFRTLDRRRILYALRLMPNKK